MIFLSAGHHFNPHGADPGAVNKQGVKEATLTKELRDLTLAELKKLGASVTIDNDAETLAQYIGRISPGSGSVVCEYHFNAGIEAAHGAETLVKRSPTQAERNLAKEVNDVFVAVGIKDRGVKTEVDSARGRLAILNTGAGLSILPEVCFISNPNDLAKYHANKLIFAKKIAAILAKYDNLYK
jgi:N-acetylmuramoyl-L-alanine amidase